MTLPHSNTSRRNEEREAIRAIIDGFYTQADSVAQKWNDELNKELDEEAGE